MYHIDKGSFVHEYHVDSMNAPLIEIDTSRQDITGVSTRIVLINLNWMSCYMFSLLYPSITEIVVQITMSNYSRHFLLQDSSCKNSNSGFSVVLVINLVKLWRRPLKSLLLKDFHFCFWSQELHATGYRFWIIWLAKDSWNPSLLKANLNQYCWFSSVLV